MSSQQLRITLAGSEYVVEAASTAGEALASAGCDGTVIAARVNGELRDLASQVADGDVLEPVDIASDDGHYIVRHSAAHVMAQAVQELFPQARLGIGPPVENGFYYDFDVDQPFTPEDLKVIEARMRQIVKQGQRFSRRVVTDEQARAELAAEPYKLELIDLKGHASGSLDFELSERVEVGGPELTIYDNLDPGTGELRWKDLCRGPHLPTTRQIPAFKLMRSGGAYWRGSEKNPQLQRIYGTAWESRERQDEHLAFLAEAEKRDHRKLGAELDLFSFPAEIGSGLAVFHPKGGLVRKILEDYSRRRHEEAGYEFVNTPHITKSELFEISGHLDWFADAMYPPMELDEGQRYYLKPMNCPFHILIFRSSQRSYRELPMRLFEFGTVYRYEKSGVVHGLTRVRGMTQDDAHIFCTPEQMPGELRSTLEFVLGLLRDYGLDDFYIELSTRPEGKADGTDEEWSVATEVLRTTAEDMGLALVLDEGGGAFYGPKISVQTRDAIGRNWQVSTIQLDFQLPRRFELEYVGADNARHRPIMIHRALFGTVERFFAILLGHYAGALPTWLSPVQVAVLPVRDDHDPYARSVTDACRAAGLRAETDVADEPLGGRIRRRKLDKVPYILVVGDDDVETHTVGVNRRGGDRPERGVALDAFVAAVVAEVAAKGTPEAGA